jgi:hypothetical protein
MIYGRFGDSLTLVRKAVLADVKALDGRSPDAKDRQNLANGAYVVARAEDNGKEYLYHLAYLRADNGLAEIEDALNVLEKEASH